MRVVFMGTPEFAVPTLAGILAAGHEVVAVYTQPPRPAGRGMAARKSPIHRLGELHDLLAHRGADLMVRALAELEDGRLTCRPQSVQGATYAAKIDKAETRL